MRWFATALPGSALSPAKSPCDTQICTHQGLLGGCFRFWQRAAGPISFLVARAFDFSIEKFATLRGDHAPVNDIKSPSAWPSFSDLIKSAGGFPGLAQMNVEAEVPKPKEWLGERSGVNFRSDWEDGYPTLSMTIDGPLAAIISYSCENEEILQEQVKTFDLGFEVARNGMGVSKQTILDNGLALVFFRNYIYQTAVNLNNQIESRAGSAEVTKDNLRALARNRKSAQTIASIATRVDATLREVFDPYVLAQIENPNASQEEH
jgi:hypothetical protein